MPLKPLLFLACLGALAGIPAQGVILRDASSFDENRFTGPIAAPAPNPNFLHSGVNLTGVGFHTGSGTRTVTLVSPKHFVYARHFLLQTTSGSNPSTVRFVAADGSIIDRQIQEHHFVLNDAGQPTDLALAELVEPIPETSGVTRQPYLNNPGSQSEFQFYNSSPNNQLIVTGRDLQAGSEVIGKQILFPGDSDSNGIDDFGGGNGFNPMRVMMFDFIVSNGADTDSRFEVGDSGGSTLVNVNGVGAIVSTNSLFQTGNNANGDPIVFRNVGAFVPHPLYIQQLNTIMEEDGYHMTEASPANASLSFNATGPTGVIRALHPVTLDYSVMNNSPRVPVNNLVIQHTLSSGSTTSITGTSWVNTSLETLFDARKGGLASRESTSLSSQIGFSTTGQQSLTVILNYDEGSPVTQTLNFTVIESFLSFVASQTNQQPGDDDDSDSVPNLVEYALGGNPSVNELVFPGTQAPLLPSASDPNGDGSVTYTFIRRTDAAARGLTYTVQESDTLDSADWQNLSISGESSTPLTPGFETVEATFTPTSPENFYRLKIDLVE